MNRLVDQLITSFGLRGSIEAFILSQEVRDSPYMEEFLSGVWGLRGSEDDRCLPQVSMATGLLCPGPADRYDPQV